MSFIIVLFIHRGILVLGAVSANSKLLSYLSVTSIYFSFPLISYNHWYLLSIICTLYIPRKSSTVFTQHLHKHVPKTSECLGRTKLSSLHLFIKLLIDIVKKTPSCRAQNFSKKLLTPEKVLQHWGLESKDVAGSLILSQQNVSELIEMELVDATGC